MSYCRKVRWPFFVWFRGRRFPRACVIVIMKIHGGNGSQGHADSACTLWNEVRWTACPSSCLGLFWTNLNCWTLCNQTACCDASSWAGVLCQKNRTRKMCWWPQGQGYIKGLHNQNMAVLWCLLKYVLLVPCAVPYIVRIWLFSDVFWSTFYSFLVQFQQTRGMRVPPTSTLVTSTQRLVWAQCVHACVCVCQTPSIDLQHPSSTPNTTMISCRSLKTAS